MPLRDHFRPPVDNIASWEGFHGGWPMVIVQHLRKLLPPDFVSEPRVHSGGRVEIDVATYERDETPLNAEPAVTLATSSVWQPSAATLTLDPALLDVDEYEVRIYDVQRRRQLVAAIEIVSPANKDRVEHREAFVAKCVALLRHGVAVSVVDLVTTRQFNLGALILAQFGQRDPVFADAPPAIYASSYRCLERRKKFVMEVQSHALMVGQPLPTIPLWLAPNLVIPLELEVSYEQACDDLAIP